MTSTSIAILDNDVTSMTLIARILQEKLPDCPLHWLETSGYRAIDRCLSASTQPDILLCDMSLTDISGPRVCKTIRAQATRPLMLAITSFPLSQYASIAAASGCQGILEKTRIPAEIAQAVDALTHDRTYRDEANGFETALTSHNRLRCANSQNDQNSHTLTVKEMFIMDKLLEGYTLKEISEQLHVRDVTVRTHISHIKDKLQAKNLSQASIRWFRMREEL